METHARAHTRTHTHTHTHFFFQYFFLFDFIELTNNTMHEYKHKLAQFDTRTYIHTCIHTYKHTYIHTHTHTHTHRHTHIFGFTVTVRTHEAYELFGFQCTVRNCRLWISERCVFNNIFINALLLLILGMQTWRVCAAIICHEPHKLLDDIIKMTLTRNYKFVHPQLFSMYVPAMPVKRPNRGGGNEI